MEAERIDSTKPIATFQGEHRWLSNFWPVRIDYQWLVYPSVEHAYQAAKTCDEGERRTISDAPTPGIAKRLGRKVTLRPDWNEIKIGVMTELLALKFRDPVLREKLRATGHRELIEGNYWGDRFWGVCQGEGEN